MKIEEVLIYVKVIFYVSLIVGVTIVLYQWVNADETFANSVKELDSLITNTLDKAQCSIDFKEFHYSGFCYEQDEAFEFIKNYYNFTNKVEMKILAEDDRLICYEK
jgi:hypothetical protein